MYFLSFAIAFGFLVLMTPQAYAKNITDTPISVASGTSLINLSVPMVNPITVTEPIVPAVTAIPVTSVAIQGVNNLPIASTDLGNSSPIPHVPVSGFIPHSGSMNGAMLTPVDIGEAITPHVTPAQEPITPPSMIPIPPTTQEPVANPSGSSSSSSHHSSGGHVIGSTTSSHSSTSTTSSGSTYKVATVTDTYVPEYDPNSTSNVRVAKLPLIAEEDMIDFDKIPHKSNLGASTQNVPVQIPLVGVLTAVVLILMIAIAIRHNTIKKQQPQVVYA